MLAMEDNQPSTSERTQTAEPAAVQAAAPMADFVKRKNRGNMRNMRKRAADEGGSGDEEDDGKSAVVRKAKQTRGEPLVFSTGGAAKQGQGEGEEGPSSSGMAAVTYEGSKQIQAGRDALVTRMLETETKIDRDARCALHG